MGPERGLPSLREVYRIGNGPSSSHTMAPGRAARLFGLRVPEGAEYRVTLCGSLAATGAGHLTEESVARTLAPAPCRFVLRPHESGPRPNAMRFEALDAGGAVLESWRVYSVGGGALEDDDGPILDGPAVRYPVSNISEVLGRCQETGRAFWSLVDDTEPDICDHLHEVWRVMRKAVRRGLETDQSVLPGGLNVPRKAEATHERAVSQAGTLRDLGLIVSFALAVAEENAAGGLVVTAPTCGSAGVLPALLFYFATEQGKSERQVLHALATAGLFGGSVATNASIAGAEVGCQGEVGTACSMAAAAAAQLLGGTPAQIEYAAEMGMEHHLGLTCDPVKGLVQIPCIERNAVAATRALDCAAYAMLGDGRHIISFDEVVAVMAETGRDLQSAYKETAAAGLAEIWRRRREKLEGKLDAEPDMPSDEDKGKSNE